MGFAADKNLKHQRGEGNQSDWGMGGKGRKSSLGYRIEGRPDKSPDRDEMPKGFDPKVWPYSPDPERVVESGEFAVELMSEPERRKNIWYKTPRPR